MVVCHFDACSIVPLLFDRMREFANLNKFYCLWDGRAKWQWSTEKMPNKRGKSSRKMQFDLKLVPGAVVLSTLQNEPFASSFQSFKESLLNCCSRQSRMWRAQKLSAYPSETGRKTATKWIIMFHNWISSTLQSTFGLLLNSASDAERCDEHLKRFKGLARKTLARRQLVQTSTQKLHENARDKHHFIWRFSMFSKRIFLFFVSGSVFPIKC